jgi:hypothetical protein
MGEMVLVLRGGAAFDGRYHRPGHGLAVADGRVRALAPDRELGSYVGAPGPRRSCRSRR